MIPQGILANFGYAKCPLDNQKKSWIRCTLMLLGAETFWDGRPTKIRRNQEDNQKPTARPRAPMTSIFGRSTPQNKAFSKQNKGPHLGSTLFFREGSVLRLHLGFAEKSI